VVEIIFMVGTPNLSHDLGLNALYLV